MLDEEREAKRWLRHLREERGLSQAALAEIVGVDRRTIHNAESEREETGLPQGLNLLRILRELGAVADAPGPSDRPLERLEEKVDEALGALGDVLELLRGAPPGAGADVGEETHRT